MPKENSSDWIRSVVITRPTLQDNTADAERLIDALKAQLETHTVDIDLSLLKRLPDLLRKWDYHVRCIFLKDRERWILISIGMLPDLPVDSYQTIGNSSLGGATMALTSRGTMDEIYQIRDRVTYLELNVNQAFMNRFSAAKFLPHTDPSRFPSVSKFVST